LSQTLIDQTVEAIIFGACQIAAERAFADAEHASSLCLGESLFTPKGQSVLEVHLPELL